MAALSEDSERETPRLHLHVRTTEGACFFELAGELDLGTRHRLDAASATVADAHSAVLDLRRLDFVDSQGIYALLAAQARLREGGLPVSVLAPESPLVYRVLTLTGADARLFSGSGAGRAPTIGAE